MTELSNPKRFSTQPKSIDVTFPTVDLSSWTSTPDSDAKHFAAQSLVSACHRFGFVAVTGHGVPADLVERAFAYSRSLFALPHATKMMAPHPSGSVPHRGYSHPGLEKAYSKDDMLDSSVKETNGEALRKVEDYKESFEIGSEDNQEQANIWLPEDVLPGYRGFMLDFYWEMDRAARRILQALIHALGIEEKEIAYLDRIHSGHNNHLRLLHYPPLESSKLSMNTFARLPAHCDWGTFTVLFQDDHGGLEFEDPQKKGHFVPCVSYGTDCLIMNVGDMLTRLTNGYFQSATHRVSLPQSIIPQVGPQLLPSRYSIPYFFLPDQDAIITTLQHYLKATKGSSRSTFEDIKFKDYSAIISKYQYQGNEE